MRDVLWEAGIDADAAFHAARIDPEIADRADGSVSGQEELAFQLAFSRLTSQRPELWTKAGLAYSLVAMGDVGLAALTAGSLAALAAVFETYADFTFWFDEPRMVSDEAGRVVAIEVGLDRVPPELREFSIYRSLGISMRVLSDLWTHGAPPVKSIEVPLRSSALPKCSIGGVPIRSGNTMRWLWPATSLSETLPSRNDLLHRRYVGLCDERYFALHREMTTAELVADAVREVIAAGPNPANGLAEVEIARRLNISVRTLQRHLRTQDVTFHQVKRDVQMTEAERLLGSTRLSIGEIAIRLGYENSANFSNAFRLQAGVTPTQWRAARKTDGGSGIL